MVGGTRLLTLALTLSLVILSPGTLRPAGQIDGGWVETRFHTGCEPGPSHPPPWPDPIMTHTPPTGAPEQVSLRIELGGTARPIAGSGFNLEHALWSCPAFRGLFRSEILDPFRPAIVRLDSGLLPAAPAELRASELGPAVYESVLSSAPYADSWRFFERLNRAGVKIVLGVWGGPAQFNLDGTRRGVLDPAHYDDYVDYVASVVHFLVRRQGIELWATTIANEPDGGDGNQISPDGLAYIAHQLAPRVAADGVMLYGPDTANGENALRYLPLLLDDPVIADNLAFVGFHQYYYPSGEVDDVLNYVRARRPDLPVIITEYTSFGFGDLDDGQESNAQIGYTLDIAAMLVSHYRQGVDAALYWDAVDYLQPGHDAITRWGFLRGPERDFQRRTRYYGMQQILQYVQPGAQVLVDGQEGGSQLHTLAVALADGTPAIMLVSQDWGPLDLTMSLTGAGAERFDTWSVTRTERGRRAERLGRVAFADGLAQVTLPPRSITTLFPSGAELPANDEESGE
jgi:O-glycosyl hydrolase